MDGGGGGEAKDSFLSSYASSAREKSYFTRVVINKKQVPKRVCRAYFCAASGDDAYLSSIKRLNDVGFRAHASVGASSR
jgi:hypothetical protein